MKKIIVVTKNWLGDILFEVPAFEMIRNRYPDAQIIALTHPRCREMLEHHPAVDRLIEFDERGAHRSLFSKIQFIKKLRAEKIDAAYFFHRSRTRAFVLKMAGIRERTGYGAKWPHFLTQAIPEPEKPLHHVDHFVNLLVAAGFEKPQNPAYSFHFIAKDRIAAENLLSDAGVAEDFICFHLGANWEPKRWPAGHFAQLADRIHEKWRLPIVVTGSAKDQPLADEMNAGVKQARVVYLIGKTGLGEAAALFARSLFVISGDSGPMHIASAVGARVIALFGPTDPVLTGPRGKGETMLFKHVPEGYTAPWYGKDLPEGGWLSRIAPEKLLKEIEIRRWNLPKYSKPQFDSLKNNPVQPAAQKSVLLITLSNIGDVIMSAPVLMSLVARYPGHHVTVVAGPRSKGVLEGSRFIDKLVIYDKHAGWKEKLRFIQELRARNYEAVVDLKNTAIPFLVSAKKRSPLFRRFHSENLRLRHLEVLEMMDLSVLNIPPFDFFNAEEEAALSQKLRRRGIPIDREWIAISPIAASELKTWPLVNFQKLIEQLLRETTYNILLVGGERETPLLLSTAAIAPERVFNAAGLTTLRESAAIIGKSKLLVAHDSSVGHFAMNMNHPSVILFGPTKPSKAAREGKMFRILQHEAPCIPCDKPQCHLERRVCLDDLPVSRVLQACLELLDAKVLS